MKEFQPLTPFGAASGCFGYGKEYSWADLRGLGFICSKGITVEARKGNPYPRLVETACGLVNSIGLENPGIDAFLRDYLPHLLSIGVPVLVNIEAENEEGYAYLVDRLKSEKEKIAGVEVNISCPNVPRGLELGENPARVRALVERIKRIGDMYTVVKLPPMGANILDLAESSLAGGADALTIANTYPALVVDIHKKKARLGFGFGGLSGPAIKPLTQRLVFLVYRSFHPVIFASGGIVTAEDALEYLLCGATYFQIGSTLFRNPVIFPQILEEWQKILDKEGIKDPLQLRGMLE
ncbi:MAG: dihydroorotate dehydrogenase [bacterium JZ-2024 1]